MLVLCSLSCVGEVVGRELVYPGMWGSSSQHEGLLFGLRKPTFPFGQSRDSRSWEEITEDAPSSLAQAELTQVENKSSWTGFLFSEYREQLILLEPVAGDG